MRIGLVIYGALETQSGGYLYDRQLVAALRRAGHEVVVLSQPWGSYGRRLLQNWDRLLAGQIAGGRFDLLLQDELNHPGLFLHNRRLRRTAAPPIVSIVHHLRSSEAHPPPLRCFYQVVERRYLHGVDGFIFNSRTTLAAVAALRGTPLPPHVVALPAANPALAAARRPRAARSGGPLRVLFVGNLQPRKGLHVLLAALDRLPRSSWTLDVVGEALGDGRYAARLRALAPAGGIIRWHGRLPDADLAQRYAAAHVLCVPSSYEGYGIVYLEAMAAGCVPLGSSAGGAAEVIGAAGWLTAPGDAPALAAQLQALHARPDWRRELAAAAQARAAAHPGWASTMARAVTFLEGFRGGSSWIAS